MHPRVVPTLKSVKGVDLFYAGQPFDLKVTYLPKGYDPELALQRPRDLGVWMYEHQGAQRFGADNRFYVVLFDRKNPTQSWKLKREFPLVFRRVDEFLAGEDVTQSDEIAFTFGNRTYTTVTKVLLITND